MIFSHFFKTGFNLIEVTVVYIGSISISFFIIRWFLVKYIQERISLIYRTIKRKKLGKKIVDIDTSTDIIQEINKEVQQWAEDTSKEIAQLESQEKFRREFIGNLSHELKTPLFNIQGYILTLLEGGLNDEKINKKYLERAEKNIERMIKLVEDLDEISKLETNRMQLNIEKVNLNNLIKNALESLEYEIQQEKVKIKTRFFKDNIFVKADKEKIQQVVINLVSNAITYSKPDDKVIEIRVHDMDNEVLVEIADNGIGIDEKHLPRLFERFYRVDESRSRHMGGSGLGLAIVKHIIEAHNQTINVRSTPGVGSTFAFTLEKA
jgi:two-component system phosphate regulon sensor histidine kinase PhoR